jgi:hypothetical protein
MPSAIQSARNVFIWKFDRRQAVVTCSRGAEERNSLALFRGIKLALHLQEVHASNASA